MMNRSYSLDLVSNAATWDSFSSKHAAYGQNCCKFDGNRSEPISEKLTETIVVNLTAIDPSQ